MTISDAETPRRKVGERIQRLRVTCRRCGQTPWEGDEPVTDNARELLADFADSSCPIGGTANGCPSTTEAQAEAGEQEPSRLRQLIKAAQARLSRSRSLMLPALVANIPQEVTVTWPSPMPDATYQVTIGQEFAALILLGKIEAAVKAGTRTAEGCTLLVAATRDVAAGQAGLHVVATP